MYEAEVEDVRSIVAQEVSFQKKVGATIDTIAQKNAQIKSYQRKSKRTRDDDRKSAQENDQVDKPRAAIE